MLSNMLTDETKEIRDILVQEILEDSRELAKTKLTIKKFLILKMIEKKIAICNM